MLQKDIGEKEASINLLKQELEHSVDEQKRLGVCLSDAEESKDGLNAQLQTLQSEVNHLQEQLKVILLYVGIIVVRSSHVLKLRKIVENIKWRKITEIKCIRCGIFAEMAFFRCMELPLFLVDFQYVLNLYVGNWYPVSEQMFGSC